MEFSTVLGNNKKIILALINNGAHPNKHNHCAMTIAVKQKLFIIKEFLDNGAKFTQYLCMNDVNWLHLHGFDVMKYATKELKDMVNK